MAYLTRKQLADMTGLSSSTLTRNLRRFEGARVGRGRYDSEDPQLSAWLTNQQLNGRPRKGSDVSECPPTAPARSSQRPGSRFAKLPSGWIIPRHYWDLLRRAGDATALAVLDAMISKSRLRPHAAAPDALPYKCLRLASGTTVNESQWRILRTSSERSALAALDVLIRRWGCHE